MTVETKTQEKKHKSSCLSETLFLVAILGMSGYISWNARGIWGISNETHGLDNKFLGQPYLPGFNPDSLSLEGGSQDVDLPSKIYQLQRKSDALNEAFFELAKSPGTESSLESIRQIAIEHLFDHLSFLNTIGQKVSFVDESSKMRVSLDQETFDLSRPLEFQALFGIAELKLESANLDKEIDKTTDETAKKALFENKSKNLLNQQSILWLKHQDIQIRFAENGVLLATPPSLASFARALWWTNALGYPYPRIGIFGPDPDAGGRFIAKGLLSSEHTTIDYLNRYGLVDSLVHETGHFISEASRTSSPAFSLESFDDVMKQAENRYLPAVNYKDNIHYYLRAGKRGKREEQYAEFFSEYLINGDNLRSKISQMEKGDPAAARILQTEYAFFQQLFQGQEFINGGFTKEELDKQTTEITGTKTPTTKEVETAKTPQPIEPAEQRAYSISQKIRITDKDTEHPGILLRDFPAGHVQADSAVVFDYDVVEIVEGPFVITRQYILDPETRKEEVKDMNWWKVRLLYQGSQSSRALGYRREELGWIEERRLGAIYQPETPKP